MTDILQDAEPGQQFSLVDAVNTVNAWAPAAEQRIRDAYTSSAPPTPEEEYWAGLIVTDLRSSIANIISAGLNLIAAKAALSHGSWLPMLALAGVGERKAQTLMQIARHPVLSDPQHVALLPSSWGTLRELAELSDEDVLGALESGAVTPDTSRAEAAALRQGSDSDLFEDEDPEPEARSKKASPAEFAEQRDAAVFSARQAHLRLGDCLKVIQAPGFRLTVEVAQDIQRELNKVDKLYGDLLIYLDGEAGSYTAPAKARSGAGKIIPAESTSAGIKAGRTEVSLGGVSDGIGDSTITLEQWKERQ